jgi:hypothetical protein
VPRALAAEEVGDSISIDAQPYLEANGVPVNATVSRQWDQGVAVVGALVSSHQLMPTIIFALGSNGTVTAAQIDQLVATARGVHHIVLVTVRVPRSWEIPDNAVIEAGAGRYPGLVSVADWYRASANEPAWFAADGVHLTSPGARAFTSVLLSATRS